MTDFSSTHLISAYVDDRLSPEERAQVEALLESSAEARAELESYRQLRTTLKALPRESAPADLLARVMAQAEQESLHGKQVATVAVADDKSSFRKRWAVPAVSVSVVASLGLLLLVMLQSRPQHGALENAPATAAGSLEADSSGSVAASTIPEEAKVADSEVMTLNREDLHDLRHNLDLSEQLPVTESFDADGTMRMISSYDLRTAKVGDVVETLQMKGDRVAVVRLTVLDRQRVLDSLHILLSDMEVPQEARGTNTYGERKSDYYAVYVEAGEGRLEALMERLRQNTDIEQMYVSTTIPSADLNPYVAEQGYGHVWAVKNQDEQLAKNRKSIPAEKPLDEAGAFEASKTRESNQPARPPQADSKAAEFYVKPQKEPEKFRRSIARSDESKFPPPPPGPVPLKGETKRFESNLEDSPAAKSPARMKVASDRDSDYRERQVTLRIPESVGDQLIAPQEQSAQLSVGNAEAANRPIEKQKVEDLRKRLLSQQEPSSSEDIRGGAGGSGRSIPAVRFGTAKSAPSEAAVELSAPKPDAAMPEDKAERESLVRSPERDSRPVQVLFLLTDDTASLAKPVPRARPRPEAEQPPK